MKCANFKQQACEVALLPCFRLFSKLFGQICLLLAKRGRFVDADRPARRAAPTTVRVGWEIKTKYYYFEKARERK